ncbi:MAG: tetratricopeptide repeat protein [Oryzomonas sp.]|uniref:O-linked N-acetylglucosamine transferase, SPINDLY family protein n=1 Tax=Oryzomonas sp. TaxID=2855186 RepID=UPI00283FB5E5|nr:tetratricopeptide repeat protein [Oryzomonas sp.]MDR3581069.1 tetratricopeptide repeat protein [Oryzomonas sp.]
MTQREKNEPDGLNRLCDEASALHAAGDYGQSLAVYERILSESPENLRALHGIGVVLHKLGRSEEGIASVRKALDLNPDFSAAYNNLGNIYVDMQKYEEALDCYQRLTNLEPGNSIAFKNMSLALLKSGRLDEALSVCSRALEIDPLQPENYMTMGNIHGERGDSELALHNYSRVIEFASHSSNAHTNILFMMNYLSRFDQQAIYRESKRWGKSHAAGKYIRRPYLNSCASGRRLRVGYVSGDFKMHPVSYHFKPVVEHHDRNAFEIFLYNNCNRFDEMTRKLMVCAEHWRNIESLSDELVAEMIRLDGIDILVDLSGHTSLHRLLVFARKPAPVQVSWLGYFNTTGMTAMDYLISDAVTVPPGEERWFSEQVVRLPDGRFCYEPPAYAPDVTSLPALGNGFITFGSFNKIHKITPETVSLWSAVLKAVPRSKIVLKTMALGTGSVQHRLFEQFEQHGVATERIEVRKESPHPQMLAEYGDIDIALDTFPFNGGATTCEALWMGVPVVTITGGTPISRQTASLLASCGLKELLAADSREDFIDKIRSLAGNTGVLARLRASFRDRLSVSPLCNGALFSRSLEHAYREMWHDWCGKGNVLSLKRSHHAISGKEYYNSGIDRMEAKEYGTAAAFFRLAVLKDHGFAEAYNNLGICRSALGKEFWRQAAAGFRKAIRLNPAFGDAYNNLGRLLTDMKSYTRAVAMCRKAVELTPDNPDAYINLGNAAREKGLYLEALDAYETAARMRPDDATALCLLSELKLSHGDAAGAVEHLKRARELAPDNPGIQSNILFAMNYISSCSQMDIYEESCAWDKTHGKPLSGLDFSDRLKQGGRLRIGYVSADFHHHAGGIFFQAIARNHDRSKFEIFCYSNNDIQDEISREIIKYAEHWRDIKEMSDDDFFTLLQQDRIDILVDLSGHSAGNRLPVFSRRAAPVQVSWLGYFNTTGLATMDYVISDFDTVPDGCELWYRETVVRMPHNRFCYTPPSICPDVESLPAFKNGYITFGCFNNIAKLTPDVIQAWCEILKRVPASRLVLKWKTLDNGAVRDYFRILFALHGIPRRRIEFRGQSPLFIMRDEYNDIDIALDPFPYTGGLTSCEALWMGVPVVTLAGDRPVSRQTKGFLKMLDLDDLSADTGADYVDIAAGLSADLDRLSRLRQGMRRRMAASPLCDGAGFTRTLEDIYRQIWLSWEKNSEGQSGEHTG